MANPMLIDSPLINLIAFDVGENGIEKTIDVFIGSEQSINNNLIIKSDIRPNIWSLVSEQLSDPRKLLTAHTHTHT